MESLTSGSEAQVSWVLDEITIYGTLTHPPGAGPFPAVVFVAGSGPTDRDWNSPLIPGTNGSAALLAQTLTAQGYLTLRYDKRASGPHVMENVQRLVGAISMQGHTDELAGAIRLLVGRPEVDPRRLFILANSEGCIHALNYQLHAPEHPCAGLILTAPPARPISAVARGQVAALVATVPGGEARLATFDAAMAAFVAGRPVQVDAQLPEGMRMLILGLTSPANQPFARELWVTDPAALVAQLATPILALIGKQDIQVDWQADGGVLEALAGQRANITIVYPEHANLQRRGRGPRPRRRRSHHRLAEECAPYLVGEERSSGPRSPSLVSIGTPPPEQTSVRLVSIPGRRARSGHTDTSAPCRR